MTNQATNIGDAAIAVLKTASCKDKADKSRGFAQAWFDENLAHAFPNLPPDRPSRPLKPELLRPKYMPKRRNLGAMLHAIAHIEFNAIDLAWDIVARFGKDMPIEFTHDWVLVADDESRHFNMIADRLASYDLTYGDHPAHDGLWQSAMDTAHDLKARLAIVPMVLEARGLDVTPSIIAKFDKAHDEKSSAAMKVIYEEEINHVYAGQKWFNFLCTKESLAPKTTYHSLINQYFKGQIKPPFNIEARTKAGLEEDFYMKIMTNEQ